MSGDQIEIESLVTEIHDEPRDEFGEPRGWAEARSNGYQPKDRQTRDPPTEAPPLPKVNIRLWQGVKPKARRWIVQDRIPAKNVTLFTGQGGAARRC
jgi:hypothetical protein